MASEGGEEGRILFNEAHRELRVISRLSLFNVDQIDVGSPLECMGLSGFVPVLVFYMVAPVVCLALAWLVGLAFGFTSSKAAGLPEKPSTTRLPLHLGSISFTQQVV